MFISNMQVVFRHGYYNTFRSSNFAHDSWKKKLRLEHIRAIEEGCKEFMQRNGYLPYSQSIK